MIHKLSQLVLTGMFMLISSSAFAARCTVTSTGLSFGNYNPFSTTPLNATGSVTFSCSGKKTVPYTIALGPGGYSGGNFANRRLFSGSAYLSYQLYTSAAHLQTWGNGTGGTVQVPGNCTLGTGTLGCSASNTIYGQIPAQQTPTVGVYQDIVTITVTY